MIYLNVADYQKQLKLEKKQDNLIIEVEEGNHENYDTDDENEREDIFKQHNFKTIRCNPNDPYFDLFKFVGKIN